MSISWEQELRIREEERIREKEREQIRYESAKAEEKAEREWEELERLREVKRVHGFGAALLMRSSGTLIVGGILAVFAFIGALMGDHGGFFFRLWEGVKAAFTFGVLTVVIALWKARKI